MVRPLLIVALFASASIQVADAQESVVKPGQTVRFQVGADDYFRSGPIARLTTDSLVLARCATCAGRLLYSRSELSHFEVMRPAGRGDRFLGGLALGALIGGGLGYLSARSCGGGDKCDLAGLAIPFGAIAGGLIGGVAGLLTAYRWEPVQAAR